MTTYTITNILSGIVLGDYDAHDEQGALDAMARDAGYVDYTDACEAAPVADGEITVVAQS